MLLLQMVFVSNKTINVEDIFLSYIIYTEQIIYQVLNGRNEVWSEKDTLTRNDSAHLNEKWLVGQDKVKLVFLSTTIETNQNTYP